VRERVALLSDHPAQWGAGAMAAGWELLPGVCTLTEAKRMIYGERLTPEQGEIAGQLLATWDGTVAELFAAARALHP